MIRMLRQRKGSMGIYSILITMLFIILLLFPITIFLVEQARLGVIVGQVRNAIDSSVHASYFSMEKRFLTQEQFILDLTLFEDYFYTNLKTELKLTDELNAKPNSIIDGKMNIADLKYVSEIGLSQYNTTHGTTYTTPFVIVNFTIQIRPMLYQQMIYNAMGKEFKEYSSERIISIPKNN